MSLQKTLSRLEQVVKFVFSLITCMVIVELLIIE